MADKVLNVHQRLAAAMGDVDYIQKEKKQGMNYTIVSHDAVTAKVRPVLLRHGIVYYPVRCEHIHNGNRAECSLTVRFVNIDEPTDFFDVPTFGYGIDPQDKGPGKAMSYAVKYALLKALGLETGDDPDNESLDYSPRDSHTEKAATVKQVGDAKLLASLKKSMLENRNIEDLKSWWTDAECKSARSKLSDDQYEALKADFTKHGETLNRSSIPGVTDAEASRHPLNA